MARPTGFMTNIVADAKGFFEEEGIKLEFVGDTGKVSGFQLIEQDVVDNEKIPHIQYIVNEASGIKSLDDIGNAKIAIAAEIACYKGYPAYYLQQHNIENNIDWVILSTLGQPEQSVVQNQVDLVTGHPPYAGKILNEGGVRRIGTSWNIFHSPGAGL